MNGLDRVEIRQRLTAELIHLLRPLPGKNQLTGPEDTGFFYVTSNLTKLHIYG